MQYAHICADQTTYHIFNQIINKCPSLADVIAEPRPEMNIKVAAFTVTEKFYNNCDYRHLKQLHCENFQIVL